MQMTLQQPIEINGFGLHTGQPVKMTVLPALEDFGIRFVRTDLNAEVSAHCRYASNCVRSTRLESEHGISIETTEHLLSALYGLGVSNCEIQLNAAELPICDGSALPFVHAIQDVGLKRQDKPLTYIKIVEHVKVDRPDGSFAMLAPSDVPHWRYDLDYEAMGLPAQTAKFNEISESYTENIAPCRTFGFKAEIDALIANGLIQGANMDCAVLFDRDRVINPEGLRHPLEPARHKLLDAIGDLSLIGARLEASYHGVKSGHALNIALAHAVLNTPSCYHQYER